MITQALFIKLISCRPQTYPESSFMHIKAD